VLLQLPGEHFIVAVMIDATLLLALSLALSGLLLARPLLRLAR
jgi:hypothetical protein